MHNVVLEDDGIHKLAEKLKTIRMTLEHSLKDDGKQTNKKKESSFIKERNKTKNNHLRELVNVI